MTKKQISFGSRLEAQRKGAHLSMEQKSAVWGRVESHISSTTHTVDQSISSTWHVWRRIASGALVTAVFGMLYGVWGVQQDAIIFDNHVFTLQRPQSNESLTPRVLASSVGQVIATDGEFSIINDGVNYRTNMLYDDDIVSLSRDSRVSFDVGGHQAYIVGPAKIRIMKELDGFVFEVLEGEYMEVFSSRAEHGTRLTVQMRDIVLAHNASDSTMKVQLTRDNEGETIIKNYADPVMVARIDDAEDSTHLAADTQLTVLPRGKLSTAAESSFTLEDVAYFVEVDTAELGSDVLAVVPEVIPVTEEVLVASSGSLSSGSVIASTGGDSDISSSSIDTTGTTDAPILVTMSRLGSGDVDAEVTTSTVVTTSSDISNLRDIPSKEQLDVLSLLLQGRDDVWPQVVKLFACKDDHVSFGSFDQCMHIVQQTYHIPPSMEEQITQWLESMYDVSAPQIDIQTNSISEGTGDKIESTSHTPHSVSHEEQVEEDLGSIDKDMKTDNMSSTKERLPMNDG